MLRARREEPLQAEVNGIPRQHSDQGLPDERFNSRSAAGVRPLRAFESSISVLTSQAKLSIHPITLRQDDGSKGSKGRGKGIRKWLERCR